MAGGTRTRTGLKPLRLPSGFGDHRVCQFRHSRLGPSDSHRSALFLYLCKIAGHVEDVQLGLLDSMRWKALVGRPEERYDIRWPTKVALHARAWIETSGWKLVARSNGGTGASSPCATFFCQIINSLIPSPSTSSRSPSRLSYASGFPRTYRPCFSTNTAFSYSFLTLCSCSATAYRCS